MYLINRRGREKMSSTRVAIEVETVTAQGPSPLGQEMQSSQ